MIFKQKNNNKKNRIRSVCGHRQNVLFQVVQLIQRQWLVASVIVIAGIMLLANSSAWAAPILAPSNQTVPIPTATPTPTPVPTVTPAPTATPEPEIDDETVEDDPEPEDELELEDDNADFFGNSNEENASDTDQPADEESDANTESSSTEPSTNSDEAEGSLSGESTADEPTTDESTTDESTTGESEEDNPTENASATETNNDQGAAAESNSDTSAVAVDVADVQSTDLTANVAVIVLNVREQPSLESVVLGTLFQDDEIEVLGRSGNWWLVCCALGSEQPAWVNSDFLEPNFDASNVDELLPVVGANSGESAPATGSSVQAADASADLELEMSLNPRYVWQGLDFELNFTVRNVGKSDVTNIVLRDELVEELAFITANASNSGSVVKETLENGNTLVIVNWNKLASGQEQTVSLQLRLDADLENGSVIDNLSVVGADETSSSTTSGISIGLRPAILPSFK